MTAFSLVMLGKLVFLDVFVCLFFAVFAALPYESSGFSLFKFSLIF